MFGLRPRASSMSTHRRLPISSYHAFALAFDLAARRDALQSLVVPLLLQTPWFLALALLPPVEQAGRRLVEVTVVTAIALLGQSFSWLLVSAMLRFRARSVFNAPGRAPAPAIECYGLGLARVPWLFVTEFVRNTAFWLAGFFLFLPTLYLGFKLSMATETVVLRGGGTAGAFARSFRLTEGRFERWLEMIVFSVVIVFSVCFLFAAVYLAAPAPGWDTYVKVALYVVFAILPVIQYAWTFFYLRLEEIAMPEAPPAARAAGDPAPLRGPWPARPGAPRLTLVESAPEARREPDP